MSKGFKAVTAANGNIIISNLINYDLFYFFGFHRSTNKYHYWYFNYGIYFTLYFYRQ